MEEIIKKYWYIGAGAVALLLLLTSGTRRKRRRKVGRITIKNKPRRRSNYKKKAPGQKPAWLVKGSEAARRHMARLRRLRRAA